jgi:hypothetical protein
VITAPGTSRVSVVGSASVCVCGWVIGRLL